MHFTLIGGAIFWLAPKSEDARAISISKASLDSLHAAQADRMQVASLPETTTREVDAREIEDEVLYREALRLGLDKDDPIIRGRLVQKLLLLVEDLGGASRTPTDAELRAYFDETRDRWKRPPRVRIAHVFATKKENLPSEVRDDAGEPFPYPRRLTASERELAQTYGDGFSKAVFSGETIAESRFGWHRVRVDERIDGGLATFEEARADLELEYWLVRRERITGTYLKKTVASYAITIDGRPLSGFVPTRRVAARPDPSAED